jgi:transcriptional regulator with XRE-family HTH domain
MKKRTLGAVVKEARNSLGLSQRQLGEEIGVKGSHIAYIEGGERRPSLHLLSNIANVLNLEKNELFLLLHPDAHEFVPEKRQAAQRPNQAWKQFLLSRALLRQNKVSAAELRVLKQVNLLGVVISPRMFLFVLNSIRQSLQ